MTRPQQIAFHVGVHATDEDRLWRSLSQNADALRAQGVELCENAINEPILNEALSALKGGTAGAEMEGIILDALVDGDAPRRLVISRPTLLGMPRRVFSTEGMMLYAGTKMLDLANALPSLEAEFFIALKNPVTLMNQLVARNPKDFGPRITASGPLNKRWAPTMRRAVQVLRGRRLVVWCHEDMPLIYPEVLRRLAGVGPEIPLKGTESLLRTLLTDDGVQQMRTRLGAGMDIETRRVVVEGLLSEYGRPEQLRAEITVPGWTSEMVAEMTDAYHSDVAEIAALPGIEFISA